jgi:hypothetical protein
VRRACRGDRMSLVPRHPWVGQIGLWAGPPVSGSWAEAGPTLCTRFFFNFVYISGNSYKILKYVENIIKLEKYKINFYIILTSISLP